MNKKGNTDIVKFIIILFIFLVFLGFSPILNSGISSSLTGLTCSEDYTITCLIVDGSLPLIAVVLLSMIIGYLKRK